ncbi:MAG TPA: hypothetical protein VK687_03480 [Bryobacteraceae bacterium]|nr:hypothetical protein [Bryobacteraceae bacterium]
MNEILDFHSKRVGQNLKSLKGHVPFSTFNCSDLCPVQARVIRENVLRPPLL